MSQNFTPSLEKMKKSEKSDFAPSNDKIMALNT